MRQELVPVELGARRYEIEIGTDLVPELAAALSRWTPGSQRALIVTDEHVRPLHAERVGEALRSAGWHVAVATQPAGEGAKALEVTAQLYDRLIELRADRKTIVMAVGGGVVGDAAGFVAATYARGLPFVQIPTTLLAAVDSSVGGKVGVNHRLAKNMIGAFHQPKGVLIDLAMLATLPEREYRAGLAEVVKYGVIMDEAFFQELERSVVAIQQRNAAVLARVVAHCCRLKARVVEQDEFETTGLRAILNYGHTFAHAYEALNEYGCLLHGEAVAIGMLDASRLAERVCGLAPVATQRQQALLTQLGLPTQLPAGVTLSHDAIIERMRLDKKSVAGELRFVLPRRIGEVAVGCAAPELVVREVLASQRLCTVTPETMDQVL